MEKEFKEFNVIAFESTHYAILTEKMLKEKFKVEMIPTPRIITASCGLSLKIPKDSLPDIIIFLNEEIFDPNMLAIYRIYRTPEGDHATKITWPN